MSSGYDSEKTLESGGSQASSEEYHQKKNQQPVPKALRYLREDVGTGFVGAIPLTCALISGLTDSTVFDAFGTFVSMQTGNTVFVGLAASGQERQPNGWVKSLVAIICFMLGSFVFGRISQYLGPARRGSLLVSFGIQAAFVIVAAASLQSGIVDGSIQDAQNNPSDWNTLWPVAMLSFQSAAQVVEARALGIGEIPTVVVTSLLVELWSDPELFAAPKANPKRNRRMAAFVLMLIGSIIGGWMTRTTQSIASALWLVAGLKVVIFCAWCWWPSKPTGASA